MDAVPDTSSSSSPSTSSSSSSSSAAAAALNAPPPTCYRCGEAGHFARACPTVQCHHCGEKGHWAVKCPTAVCEHCGGRGHLGRACLNSPAAVHFRLSVTTRQELGIGKESAPHFEVRPEGDVQPEVFSPHLSLRKLEEELDKLLSTASESTVIRPNVHLFFETNEFRGLETTNENATEGSVSSSPSLQFGGRCPASEIFSKIRRVIDEKKIPIFVILTAEAPSSQKHDPLQLLFQSRLSWLVMARPYVDEATLCCEENFTATTGQGLVPMHQYRMKTSDQRWMKNRLVVKLGLEPNPAPRSFLRVRSSILPQMFQTQPEDTFMSLGPSFKLLKVLRLANGRGSVRDEMSSIVMAQTPMD